MQELCGKWTNNRTDLVCEILKVFYTYSNGDFKVRYKLYNKKNNIVYEVKKTRINKNFFTWNFKECK